MEIDLQTLPQLDRYKLLTSVVVPRPIAWISTVNANGQINAAPFSFFNVFGSKPPLVALGIGNRPDGSLKDTVANIRSTGEFVINMVTETLADQMAQTSYEYAPDEDELARVGLSTAPSSQVSPPRIAESPVHLECRELSTQEIGQNRLILGQVIHAAIDDAFIDPETKAVLTEQLHPVGRMHGSAGYTRTNDLFQIPRPSSP
ncbi:MAG: flavin reductase family protein [Verrucomicrobiota bacterium]